MSFIDDDDEAITVHYPKEVDMQDAGDEEMRDAGDEGMDGDKGMDGDQHGDHDMGDDQDYDDQDHGEQNNDEQHNNDDADDEEESSDDDAHSNYSATRAEQLAKKRRGKAKAQPDTEEEDNLDDDELQGEVVASDADAPKTRRPRVTVTYGKSRLDKGKQRTVDDSAAAAPKLPNPSPKRKARAAKKGSGRWTQQQDDGAVQLGRLFHDSVQDFADTNEKEYVDVVQHTRFRDTYLRKKNSWNIWQQYYAIQHAKPADSTYPTLSSRCMHSHLHFVLPSVSSSDWTKKVREEYQKYMDEHGATTEEEKKELAKALLEEVTAEATNPESDKFERPSVHFQQAKEDLIQMVSFPLRLSISSLIPCRLRTTTRRRGSTSTVACSTSAPTLLPAPSTPSGVGRQLS